ncbi:restriction endonuclease subunit S [Ligilactobacillus saerimneri]|uniref:restriction endonuclease subunit S n=1 Tax=Ligilactobacillus saerimneri TaxID=228229 RepID=UPI0029432E5C|nr:restriction endonuclease subunit S [Ligilactobacillus saerimneri]
MEDISIINPKSVIPEHFKYVDLESVVGTDLISFIETDKNSAPSRAQRVARTGDIFYQTVRPYQKNNYLFTLKDKDYVFSTGYAQIRSDVDNAFLMSYLQNENFVQTVLRHSTGTSYPAISPSDLAKISVFIPKKQKEQLKIGKTFSNIDNLITLHQRKLDHLKEQKKGLLQKMFPKKGEVVPEVRFPGFTNAWEQRKLGEVVERFDNLRIPVTSSKRKRGITPYYGANGIQDYVQGYTHDGEFVLVAEDGANDLQNYPIHYVNGKVWVNNHAHVLQGKKDIADNLFLVNAIKRIKFETYLVGGSRAKLNADVMMKLPIKIPKLNEQQKLGKYFSRIDSLIALHQRKLDHLKLLKKGLLQQMFV